MSAFKSSAQLSTISANPMTNYPDIDDAPLPFELYTEEELKQMQIEQEQDDWERSIPTPADRNPRLK